MTYQVGTSLGVRALHVMPGMEGPEGRLHPHDYRLDVVVERDGLDERGMVCDLDVLNAALREAAARVKGRDLDEIRPPDAEAVTVEVFARWLHGELAEPVRMAGGERLMVRVFENEVAFGGFSAPVVRPSTE
jgi:6-pyruvoyltetrahydropterin/6-carboxytetrahydropterin synthase